jgi:DNA polymerase III subunit delta'
LKSHIRIIKNRDGAANNLLDEINSNNYKIIEKDEFLIDDAHQLIAFAYIASDTLKYLIVSANKYNNVSQNSLLKLLEEPPNNIIIILISTSKSIFLPTIRSRLPMIVMASKYEEKISLYDFSYHSLKTVLLFSKNNKYLGKEDAKIILNAGLNYYISLPSSKVMMSEVELALFNESFHLLALNSTPINVLNRLFLMLLKKNRVN